MSVATRASLLVLGFAAFMVSADARVIDPLLHIIADEFHTKVGNASIVISAYTLPYGLFQLFYGPMGDRVGKLRVMSFALLLFAVGTAACAFVSNLPLFALLRFLTGVVAAAMIPLSLAYIGDKFPYETRQAALGRFMSALMLGQVMSASLGGIFGKYVGWRDIFIVFGIVSLLVAAALWREAGKYPEVKNTERKVGLAALAPYGLLLKKPAAQLVIGAVLIEGALVFGGLAYLGAFMRERFRLEYDTIGFMLSGVGVGGLLYSVSVKWLVKKVGEMGILLIGGLFLFAAYLSLSLLTVWQLFPLITMMAGIGFYTMHSTLQTRATELAPEARGTAVSLFAFGLFLGQSIGVAAIGRIIEWKGYSPAFATVGVGLLLLTLWARWQFPRLPRPAKPA